MFLLSRKTIKVYQPALQKRLYIRLVGEFKNTPRLAFMLIEKYNRTNLTWEILTKTYSIAAFSSYLPI